MTYASPRGHVFLNLRLYLPGSWCPDHARRERAHVPELVCFQTKPEPARALLEHAWELDTPMRWVTGGSVYGESTPSCQAIERTGNGTCWR